MQWQLSSVLLVLRQTIVLPPLTRATAPLQLVLPQLALQPERR